jgi:hypothetical protein
MRLRSYRQQTKAGFFMANQINIGMQHQTHDAFNKSETSASLDDESGNSGNADTLSTPSKPDGLNVEVEPEVSASANLLNRYSIGDTVILGRPDYANSHRDSFNSSEFELIESPEETPVETPSAPPASSPLPVPTIPAVPAPEPSPPDPVQIDPTPVTTPPDTSAPASPIDIIPAPAPDPIPPSPSTPTPSIPTPPTQPLPPTISAIAGLDLSAAPAAAMDSAAYAAAAEYGLEHGYSDEMIAKLAVLLQTESSGAYANNWLSNFPDVLIYCVDSVTKNTDDTYNMSDASHVFNYYLMYDPRYDQRLDRGHSDSGGSSGGDGAGDRYDDFMVIFATDPHAAFLSQASPMLAALYAQSTTWSPQQIREQQDSYANSYISALTAGDTASQAETLNDMRLFNRAVNPQLSDDAAIALALDTLKGIVNPTQFARDQNGHIVFREVISVDAQQALATADADLDSLDNHINENIFGTQVAAGNGTATDAQSPLNIVNNPLLSLAQRLNLVERDLSLIDQRVAEFTRLEADARASGNTALANRYQDRVDEFLSRQSQYREATQMLGTARTAQSFSESLYSNDRGYSREQIDAAMNRILRRELPIGGADEFVRNQMVGNNPGLWASLNDPEGLALIVTAGTIGRALTRGTPSVSNYRTLFRQNRPDMPPDYQVHHSIPQKYADRMAAEGVNIHEVQYLRGVDDPTHREINNLWRTLDRQNNGDPTIAQIRELARQIDQRFGSKFIWPK